MPRAGRSLEVPADGRFIVPASVGRSAGGVQGAVPGRMRAAGCGARRPPRYRAGMKIYTKTGDGGTTGLYGGERVPKDHPRVAAYGAVDEVNALLGVARAHLGGGRIESDVHELQNALFAVGADLATPADAPQRAKIDPIGPQDVARLEARIDAWSGELEPLTSFVLPGGAPASAALHVARAAARRAERAVVALARSETVGDSVPVWLNRLSDLLFVLARAANVDAGVSEERWRVEARVKGVPSDG